MLMLLNISRKGFFDEVATKFKENVLSKEQNIQWHYTNALEVKNQSELIEEQGFYKILYSI
jgi:hypothetical protein